MDDLGALRGFRCFAAVLLIRPGVFWGVARRSVIAGAPASHHLWGHSVHSTFHYRERRPTLQRAPAKRRRCCVVGLGCGAHGARTRTRRRCTPPLHAADVDVWQPTLPFPSPAPRFSQQTRETHSLTGEAGLHLSSFWSGRARARANTRADAVFCRRWQT